MRIYEMLECICARQIQGLSKIIWWIIEMDIIELSINGTIDNKLDQNIADQFIKINADRKSQNVAKGIQFLRNGLCWRLTKLLNLLWPWSEFGCHKMSKIVAVYVLEDLGVENGNFWVQKQKVIIFRWRHIVEKTTTA